MSLPDKGEAYTCANCGGRFVAGADKVAATAESERTFGGEVSDETHAVVCDECWVKILAWHERTGGGRRLP